MANWVVEAYILRPGWQGKALRPRQDAHSWDPDGQGGQSAVVLAAATAPAAAAATDTGFVPRRVLVRFKRDAAAAATATVQARRPLLSGLRLADGSQRLMPAPGTPEYSSVFDEFGHGTHVGGTIAAAGNNSIGVTGLSWQVSLYACNAFSSAKETIPLSAQLDCYALCGEAGARVVNLSFGGMFSQLEFEALERLGEGGTLVVAAGGNEGRLLDAEPTFPAAYRTVTNNILTGGDALLRGADHVPALKGFVTSAARLNVARSLAVLLGEPLPPRQAPQQYSWNLEPGLRYTVPPGAHVFNMSNSTAAACMAGEYMKQGQDPARYGHCLHADMSAHVLYTNQSTNSTSGYKHPSAVPSDAPPSPPPTPPPPPVLSAPSPTGPFSCVGGTAVDSACGATNYKSFRLQFMLQPNTYYFFALASLTAFDASDRQPSLLVDYKYRRMQPPRWVLLVYRHVCSVGQRLSLR
ncbi:peptidase S8 and S53 subtilisin kexin sedolisin [Micractinium conductrix]|uniref:Peptidase S8 and S53 subtilisin kexin sedolisin n=1 Tax=Micractinium conductrix TaxID=554055 RepID=A0A2P6UZ72_9CHLO|nr:peptidase S8 and S53 subtilisin kexin sedolisin [Micractinium conductrix]|eukprot:PSC67137.1 peptidase S8 and S53 subtilisin kexin sedolisin [Micractinium conductrix]